MQDDGLPNLRLGFPGNYLSNPALQRSLDHFFENSPDPGGIGLQDRYAAAWAHVARRFRGDHAVLGYEILNEPFPGTNWPQCENSTGCPVFDAKLTAFYARVDHAIRRVDPRTLVFYEPNVLFNGGAVTNLGRLGDRQTVFSFHDYCLSQSFGGSYTGCGPADDKVFAHALTRAALTGNGVLESEWGATDDPTTLQANLTRADQNMTGWLEWAYTGHDITSTGKGDAQALVLNPARAPLGSNVKTAKLRLLVEPHPEVIAGTPTRFSYDPGSATFELKFSTARAGGGRFPSGSETDIAVPRRAAFGDTVRGLGAVWIANESPRLLEDLNPPREPWPSGRFLLRMNGRPIAWTEPSRYGHRLDELNPPRRVRGLGTMTRRTTGRTTASRQRTAYGTLSRSLALAPLDETAARSSLDAAPVDLAVGVGVGGAGVRRRLGDAHAARLRRGVGWEAEVAHGPRAGHDEDAAGRAGRDDRVRRAGRKVDVVPAPQRPLEPLHQQHRLPLDDERALLVVLGVVHRRALAGLEHAQVKAKRGEPRGLALEVRRATELVGVQPGRVVGVEDEPAVARGNAADGSVLELRLGTHAAHTVSDSIRARPRARRVAAPDRRALWSERPTSRASCAATRSAALRPCAERVDAACRGPPFRDRARPARRPTRRGLRPDHQRPRPCRASSMSNLTRRRHAGVPTAESVARAERLPDRSSPGFAQSEPPETVRTRSQRCRTCLAGSPSSAATAVSRGCGRPRAIRPGLARPGIARSTPPCIV